MPVRRELEFLLRQVAASTGATFELLPPGSDDVDVLSTRYHASAFRRLPATSLPEAVSSVIEISRDFLPGPWLIRPDRLENVGLIRLSGAPSGDLLNALASWSGDGLLLGPERSPGWILLDLERMDDWVKAEVLVAI